MAATTTTATSDIPSIKVDEDYNSYDANNNLEVFKKINALLENTLDLSSLATNSPAQGQEKAKGSATGGGGRSLEQLFGNMHFETPTQKPRQSCLTTESYATTLPSFSLATPTTTSTHQLSCNAPDFLPTARTYHHYAQAYDPYGYTQRHTDYTTTAIPPPKTVYSSARHPNDFSQASQNYHTQAHQTDFIQGAISNRTLEQITESFARPYRAIKAASDYKMDGLMANTMTTPEQKPRMEDGFTRLFNRGGSPTDSDTSGIGSECSDSMLVDLMNSLSLTQPGAVAPHTQAGSTMQTNVQNGQSAEMLRVLGFQQEALRQDCHTPASVAGSDCSDAASVQLAMNPLFSTTTSDPYSIERAAKLYRSAASICEASCTWSGQLPPKIYKSPTYSCKVFLGGVPWDITEAGLQGAFKMFGPMKIEWPGRDGKHPRYPPKAGYVYVLFDCEKSVRALLQACTQDFSNGGEYYYRISSRRMRSKEVQVIPWVLCDSNYVRQPSQRLDPTKTVFVGALHGMLTAEALASIMNDLFGNVVYAGIDTDKHKYPIGSGRVTFSSHKSYMKAVNAAFVEVKTPKFTKKIQVDPYLEDSLCNVCGMQQGPFFCRDLTCFRYFCRTCWQWTHAFEATRHHKPLMRNNRGNSSSSSTASGV